MLFSLLLDESLLNSSKTEFLLIDIDPYHFMYLSTQQKLKPNIASSCMLKLDHAILTVLLPNYSFQSAYIGVKGAFVKLWCGVLTTKYYIL